MAISRGSAAPPVAPKVSPKRVRNSNDQKALLEHMHTLFQLRVEGKKYETLHACFVNAFAGTSYEDLLSLTGQDCKLLPRRRLGPDTGVPEHGSLSM